MTEAPSIEWNTILGLVDAVPEIAAFPSVDELVAGAERIAASTPARVRRRRIGSSRLGEPIHALTVGDGPRHAVVIGGVHPNEPIGGLTAMQLARTLVADEELTASLGYTWHIIACVDPDGMRLNEGWFGGTLDRGEYGRLFYRPEPAAQVEWTFPVEYKELYFDQVMPETLALMRLIDDVRPTLLCSLHNAEFGGVYYYLSHPAPELYPALHGVPRHVGIPLDTGEPEIPHVPVLADAIYQQGSIAQAYEYRVALGLDPQEGMPTGMSSMEYAAKYGTFSLVCELPYWTHPDAADDTPSDRPYVDVLRFRADGLSELGCLLTDVLREAAPDLRLETPHLAAMREFAPHFVDFAEREKRRAGEVSVDRMATVAESFTGNDIVHCFRLRYGGMTLRALEAEIVAGNGTPLIRRLYARLDEAYRGWAVEASQVTPAGSTIPIRDLVGVQLGAILAASSHAADRFGPGAG